MLENIELVAENMPWVFTAFAFIFGACIGSFLNVCIYRIPNGESIVRPPSHCKCGAKIKWFDNIPILSWFLLRGRARCCGRKFSFRYAFVEILTAYVFALVWAKFSPLAALVFMFFCALLIVASFIDIDCMELPDAITVGGCVAGCVLSFLVPQIHVKDMSADLPFLFYAVKSFMVSAIGAFVGAGLLYWIRLIAEVVFGREAMGEGDVVLIGCIGAFCGWQGALFAIFGGSLLGSAIMLPAVLFSKAFARGENLSRMIPFGPWLSLGAAIYLLFAGEYVDLYFEGIREIFF
ncbi:MAG: prepilin peptidase [Opitutales bacterium]|nr:prepilin peptidase [Opitutales bacterium]